MAMWTRLAAVAMTAYLAAMTGGCARSSDAGGPIRLVDRFDEARLEGMAPAAESVPPAEWLFSGGEAGGAPGSRGSKAPRCA